MPELSRQQVAVVVAALVVIGALGLRHLGRDDGTAAAPASGVATPAIRVQASAEAGGMVTVHVAGAVRRPGVYRVRSGTRVDDAVRRAGGPTRRADLGAVNLAAKVQDGRQILVPERARGGAAAGGAGGSAAEAEAGAGAAGAGAVVPGQPLNLNTATLEQLDTLDGVGPATAQKILEHREQRGGFGSVEELGEIPGIGEKRLASLREQATV